MKPKWEAELKNQVTEGEWHQMYERLELGLGLWDTIYIHKLPTIEKSLLEEFNSPKIKK